MGGAVERGAVSLWLIFLGMGAATYLLRLSFIGLQGRLQPSSAFEKALRFVPAAVLAALILPAILVRSGMVEPLHPRFLAGLLALLIAWITRSVFVTIAAGMLALWILQALF